jgi:predicted metal-binding protein
MLGRSLTLEFNVWGRITNLDISNLVTLEILKIKKDNLVFSPLANDGTWCQLPYPRHRRGCINFNKNKLCPPFAPYLKNKLNYKNYRLMLAHFDFGMYKEEMKYRHPEWSDDLIKSVIYWQSQIKKVMKIELRKKAYTTLFSCGSGFDNSYSMEAVGINVFATLRKVNTALIKKEKQPIHFEVKPQKKIVLCCLICSNQLCLT